MKNVERFSYGGTIDRVPWHSLRGPELVFTLHLMVLALVPYWWGPVLGGFFVPVVALSLAVALAAFRSPLVIEVAQQRIMLLFAVTCLVAVVGFGSALSEMINLLVAWLGSFILGTWISHSRLSKMLVRSRIAIAGVMLGTLALVERAADFHPFANLVTSGPWEVWNPVQYRDGVARSEWAMGHSIALGVILAGTIPFIWWTARGYRRVLAVSVVMLGVATTQSRLALICAGVGVLLCALSERSNDASALRWSFGRAWAVAVTAVLVMLAGFSHVMSYLAGAQNEEVASSNSYRLGYVDLLDGVRVIGPSALRVSDGAGGWLYPSSLHPDGIAKSIDSTVLLVALQFGWLPAITLLALVVSVLIAFLSRPTARTVEMMAVVSLIPCVFLVDMITQVPYFFWLLCGLATSSSSRHVSERGGDWPDF